MSFLYTRVIFEKIKEFEDYILFIKTEGQRQNAKYGETDVLASYEMCLKALQHWTKRAKITKHISWHCARHSFATNILDNGANIAVVGALLGHSSLQHTQKYLRAVDKRKQEAIDSLPELRL